MKILKVVSIFTVLLLLSSIAPVFAVGKDEFPRLDEAIGIVVYPEASAMVRARAGEIDNLMGMINPDNVEELMGLGWSISANPGFHMCYLGINCRPYTLDTSGQPSSGGSYPPYGVREPGWSLYPTNLTEFRYALHLLTGCRKTDWIAELYRFINVRLDTTIPPASVYWFNPAITPVPYDPVQAYKLLIDAGWSNATGIWIMPNGQELRKIWVLSPIEAPPSVTLCGKCADSWNEFFGKGSDGEYYFIHSPQRFYDIIDWVFINRDHDIYFLCWGLGRNPDYLYDFFHPDVDIPDGANSPGLNFPPLNDELFAIKYWRWPNGTFITTLEDMKKIVYSAQEKLYVLTPYIPLYSRKYHNAYVANLQGWVESLGYGSGNFFTYNWIWWKDPTKGSWRFHISGPLSRLNPITSTSAYDWQVLNLLLDGLLIVDPFTHEDRLWAAKEWTPFGGYEAWSDPDLGVKYGMKVTFKIRPGIKWQDGVQVDANTLKWNLDFITSIEAPRYYDIWANYVKSEVTGTDTLTIYINNTGLWLVYSFAGSVLLLPPHIYGPHGPVDADDDGNVTYAEVLAFKPYDTPHPTVPDLKCLIGTGPWIFKVWDTLTQTVRLVENNDYFAYNFVREDLNFDGIVNIKDVALCARAFGATPGHPRWLYGQCDVVDDKIVNIKDIFELARRFGRKTLP
ncbi:MAG: ABC transporter substrate-binding protein [Candidatus Bathyarchaeia archaeon]|nr:ABC transporter substrate-binding protein [Candidatus Bathyarchaeia archaeon]